MKRPCFALTMLMAALAGSLAAVGTANSQTGLEPDHTGSWRHECPFAPSGLSENAKLCDDEDARWQAHQIEESLNDDYTVPANDSPEASVPAAVEATAEPTPAAEVETIIEPTPATEVELDQTYRSGYDGDYDHEVYRPEPTEVPVEEPAPVVSEENVEQDAELDPYWTEGKLPVEATEELDPYWNNTTNDEAKYEAREELDPYWTENKLPADVTEELDPYWTENKLPEDVAGEVTSDQIEAEATIDPEWTRDSVEAVQNWIERLNSRTEAEGAAVESDVPSVEPQQDAIETPVPTGEATPDEPVENADPIYGPHHWDDCDLGHKSRNCERPTPEVTNYAEPATSERNESFNAVEHREVLRSVAHMLNEAGEALQAASHSLSRIADGTEDQSTPYQGYDSFDGEYRD